MQIGQDLCVTDRKRRVGKVNPNFLTTNGNWIGSKLVSTVKIFPSPQIEFPVVPVTSQYTLVIETAFFERVSFVGTTVVTRKYTMVGEKNNNLPTVLTKQFSAGGFEIL